MHCCLLVDAAQVCSGQLLPSLDLTIWSYAAICILACRGYLARGVLFRGEGRQGDAERMFLQARYIAPKESRALVDKVIGP